MRAFVMNEGTPAEFIDRVERELGERGLEAEAEDGEKLQVNIHFQKIFQ